MTNTAAPRSTALVVKLSALVIIVTLLLFAVAGGAIEDWTAARLAEPNSRWLIGLILALLLASDIVLPVPSSVAATAAGAMLGAVGGTIAAGGGLAGGALIGLMAARRLGRDRVAATLGPVEFARLEAMLARAGPLVVLLCRPVPVLAETSVLVAGACGASTRTMAAPIIVGSVLTGGVYALLGSIAHDRATFVLVFVGSCAIPALAWAASRLWTKAGR